MKLMISAVLLVAPLLGGCTLEQTATPEELARVTQLEQEIVAQEGVLRASEMRGKELFATLQETIKMNDKAGQEAAWSELAIRRAEWENAKQVIEPKRTEINQIVTTSNQRSTGNIVSMVAPWLPAPLQPLVPLGMYLGGLLATKRGRENLGKSVGTMFTGHIWQAAEQLGKSVGYFHTNKDAQTVGVASAKMFKKEGNIEAAEIMANAAKEVKAMERRKAAEAEERFEALTV